MTDQLRYERKIALNAYELEDFAFWLRAQGGGFTEAYPKRTVNSIYFDSLELDDLIQNLSGISDRKKLRLRWYGDAETPTINGRLEVKVRRAGLGSKIACDLSGISLQKITRRQLLAELYRKVPPEMREHLVQRDFPTIYCRYEREYYKDSQDVRITLDTAISYRKLGGPYVQLHPVSPSPVCGVLEIKYPHDFDLAKSPYLSNIPFRVYRNSKYVNGMLQL